MRNRDVDFGSVRENVSYVLTATEPAPDTGRTPAEFAPVPGVGHRTVATMSGAAVLSSSSYGPSPPRIPEGQPYAAFDHDPSSGWVPTGFLGGKAQWVQVRFDGPRSIPYVDIRRLSAPGWRTRVTRVVVSTERGARTAVFQPADDVQRVHLPVGRTRALRVTITGVSRVSPAAAGIAEIEIPGIEVRRSLALAADQRPRLAAGTPLAGIHLTRSSADPFDATRHDEEVRLDRRVDIPRPAVLTLRGTTIARPGDALSGLVASLASGSVRAVASSVWSDQPAFRGENAMDGNASTSWVADPGDKLPQLTLVWNGARTVDGIAVVPARGPIQAPERLRISAESEHHDVTLAGTSASFPAMTTDAITVTVLGRAPAPPRSRGAQTPIAVGLSELVVHGLGDQRAAALDPQSPLQLPCGDGPDVVIDGVTRKTSVRGRVGDLILARPIPFEGCDGPVALEAGNHSIETTLAGPLAVENIDLTTPVAPSAPTTRRTAVRSWAPEHRRVDVGPGAQAYLTVNENANDGWSATLEGRRLTQVRLDGWRQGWLLPAGSGGRVELNFAPGHTYRVGLLVGALGVLAVIVLSLLASRSMTPPSTPRTFPVVVTGGAATLAVWLVAGPVALAVPAALAAARERSALLPRSAGVAYACAAGLVMLQPGRAPGSGAGAYGRPAQLLSGIAIAAMLAVVIAPERT
jgi:arabinofuranan 3-O-arabinosyltransferase